MPAETIDRTNLQRVVALLNGKGGVGKTTLTANIGALLAESGWKVLLVDLDFQGHLRNDLGIKDTDKDDGGVELSKALQFDDHIPQPVKDVRPGLDMLVAGPEIEGATAALASQAIRNPNRAKLSVALMLNRIAADYDIILIDSPPQNETMQTAIVAAARYILIPTKSDDGSLDGLEIAERRLDSVLELNPDLGLLGVVLFGSGTAAKRVREEAYDDIAARLGGESARQYIFTSSLRHSEATAKATRKQGLVAHELDNANREGPKWWEQLKSGKKEHRANSAGSVADDIRDITAEMVQRILDVEAKG